MNESLLPLPLEIPSLFHTSSSQHRVCPSYTNPHPQISCHTMPYHAIYPPIVLLISPSPEYPCSLLIPPVSSSCCPLPPSCVALPLFNSGAVNPPTPCSLIACPYLIFSAVFSPLSFETGSVELLEDEEVDSLVAMRMLVSGFWSSGKGNGEEGKTYHPIVHFLSQEVSSLFGSTHIYEKYISILQITSNARAKIYCVCSPPTSVSMSFEDMVLMM